MSKGEYDVTRSGLGAKWKVRHYDVRVWNYESLTEGVSYSEAVKIAQEANDRQHALLGPEEDI